jgi:hypothetical protein
MKPFKVMLGKSRVPATITSLGSVFDSTAGVKLLSVTPAVGDLLVVLVAVSNLAAITSLTDNQGGTYTGIVAATRNPSNDVVMLYIRDSFVTSAVAHQLTANMAATSTGSGIGVLAVKGMTQAGINAYRSSGYQTAQVAGLTPAPVLNQAPLARNPVIGAFFTGVVANTTPRAGYTEHWDSTHLTPDATFQCMSRDSGETSQTITWGAPSAAGSTWGAIAVELNGPP